MSNTSKKSVVPKAQFDELKRKYTLLERLSASYEERSREKTKELTELFLESSRREKLADLGKLAGYIGHELRGPLGVIRNSVEFLKLRLGRETEEKVKRHLNILSEETNAVAKIISNILDFLRIKELSPVMMDINSMVRALVSAMAVPANIKVRFRFKKGMLRLKVDPVQIQRAFSNIISNAIEAMPHGGTLTISTAIRRSKKDLGMGYAKIDFNDTGEGIPEHNLKKIFEPLFTTKEKGTGLGLSVCQSIVDAHRGSIEVESEMEKGSTFRGTTVKIKLPFA
jgi:signal transduction histidine kinase